MVKSLYATLSRLFPTSEQRRDQLARAYLDEAVSLYDLECRQREIASGRFAGQDRFGFGFAGLAKVGLH